MNKLGKLVFVGILMVELVGCASVGSIANKYANNNSVEGVIYGAGLDHVSAKSICESINNKDERCTESEKYQAVFVAAKMGYADGFTGIVALAPIGMDIGEQHVSGSSNSTYLKAKVEKNKLGTILEVASRPGDGKCHWSGMPRVGGTVCPAYSHYHPVAQVPLCGKAHC
jgi:hypothetical protein